MKRIPEDMLPGTRHRSNNYGEFRIVNYMDTSNVLVQFYDTQYEVVVQATAIRLGTVRDRLLPIVHGVGFIGVGTYSTRTGGKKNTCYNKWANMISRCYGDSGNIKNAAYSNVSVCPEWHNFQNFAKWFYENYPDDGNVYHLDKDYLIPGNLTYHPNACTFLSAQQNCEVTHAKRYHLISPSGEDTYVYNMATFCKKHGLLTGEMSRVANGKSRTHHGWTKA